ncbi:MAG: insulinase family protein [Bacteroidetes bacterium]|nr:insulinase family protein [Bacteroidota bacterium]
MLNFEKHTLQNGLTVIVNHDATTPLVAMNILYKVGARNEDENKTGFAHLFEHLMFGGSVNIPSYDEPLQRAGGENNAFTNNDFTNYYLTLPAQNIETAFWLESDRMLSLAFSDKSLEVQRHVVVEEFKQRYLNQPYGDVWLHLRPMAYKVHPYRWATIGKEISHIEQATMDDVKDFFATWYRPDNAILTLSGNILPETAFALSEKWFGEIKSLPAKNHTIPQEPVQTEKRTLELERDVPANTIYKAYHTCSRFDKDFIATELLADILTGSKSARLYYKLVKQEKIFNTLSTYFTGDLDKGLFIVDGRLHENVSFESAEKALDIEIANLTTELITEKELTIVQQKTESALVFSEMNIANRALNLAYFEMIGDASLLNKQIEQYRNVTREEIRQVARKIFFTENESVLYYKMKEAK